MHINFIGNRKYNIEDLRKVKASLFYVRDYRAEYTKYICADGNFLHRQHIPSYPGPDIVDIGSKVPMHKNT